MIEPSVADVLEWEALPEDVRERYLRVVRDGLYEELRGEVGGEIEIRLEDKYAEELQDLREVLNEAEATLSNIVKESENALDSIHEALA